jgi:hypothetical protein
LQLFGTVPNYGSASAMWLPIKPAPPVTSTLMFTHPS